MSPNQIASRSRSAGSPALPTAMTMRPQLASSPAIAVLTSGELAIDSAIRRAERSRHRALDPRPRRTSAPPRRRAPPDGRDRGAGRRAPPGTEPRRRSRALAICARPAWPVAKRSSVSEVEVSLSTVMALKLSLTPSASSACSTGAAIGASVTTKESIVAMSGAIMPAPLAMPLMVTVASPSSTRRGGALRDRCRWS